MRLTRAIRRRAHRRVAVAEFLSKLDALGADEDTRTALLTLVALGMPADSIRRLGMAYAKGLRIEVVNDYYPGPGTPGVYGVRREP